MNLNKKSNDTNDIIKPLQRIIEELNTGYTPPFVMVIYPSSNRKECLNILGFNEGDTKSAIQFNELINDMQEEFQQRFSVSLLGVDQDQYENAKRLLDKDVQKAMERAFDAMKKDKPVTNTDQAEAMLKKILAKGATEDDQDS